MMATLGTTGLPARGRTRVIAMLGVAAGLLVLLAGPMTRWGVLPWQAGLALFALGAIVAGVAAIWSIVALIRGARGRVVMLGAIVGALGFGALATVITNGRGYPAIHDISTDTANPPAFVAVTPELRGPGSNPLAYPPENVVEQTRAYPQVKPVIVPATSADAFRRAVALVQARGWQIVAAVPSAGRIEATATASWWGFKDDIVLRFTPDASGTRVDIRSVSRVGRSDFGANAKRIEALAHDLR
ncbi:MAG: DUF1499 domain-containing protein [Sphingomonas sp.]